MRGKMPSPHGVIVDPGQRVRNGRISAEGTREYGEYTVRVLRRDDLSLECTAKSRAGYRRIQIKLVLLSGQSPIDSDSAKDSVYWPFFKISSA